MCGYQRTKWGTTTLDRAVCVAEPMSTVTAFEPLVDVLIAVHDLRRPVERAVESVLQAASVPVRVTVVCHGIGTREMETRLAAFRGPELRVVSFSDGIFSPAGPFNHGIGLATARYVSVLGSDDFFEPGALDSWSRLAAATNATAVLAPVRGPDARIIHSPLVRPSRRTALDPVLDRLTYRSAPLGLIDREWAQARQPFFTEGLVSGEDVNPSNELWFTAGSLAYASSSPAYGGGYDAVDRVTYTPMSMSAELGAMFDLLGREWVNALGRRERRALAIKVFRENLIESAVGKRRRMDDWGAGELDLVRDLAIRWARFAPGAVSVFSFTDRLLMDRLFDPLVREAEMVAAVVGWRGERSRVRRLLPRNPLRVFDRESAVRRMVDLEIALSRERKASHDR